LRAKTYEEVELDVGLSIGPAAAGVPPNLLAALTSGGDAAVLVLQVLLNAARTERTALSDDAAQQPKS